MNDNRVKFAPDAVSRTLPQAPPARAVRLQLHELAYNLANFLRTLALPGEIAQW